MKEIAARLGDVLLWFFLLLAALVGWMALRDKPPTPSLELWFSWWWSQPEFWFGLIFITIGWACRYILRGPE